MPPPSGTCGVAEMPFCVIQLQSTAHMHMLRLGYNQLASFGIVHFRRMLAPEWIWPQL